jgi:hypothetical protein
VFRLELEPVQLPRLIDELDTRAGDLDNGLELPAVARDRPEDTPIDVEHYELWLLRRMRAVLPELHHSTPFAWCGPTGLVTTVVRAGLRAATAELATIAADLPRATGPSPALEASSAEVAAWTRTVLDCDTVEDFTFEPNTEPSSVASQRGHTRTQQRAAILSHRGFGADA